MKNKLKTPCNWYTRGDEQAEKKQSLKNEIEQELKPLVVVNVKKEMANLTKEQEFFPVLVTLSRKVEDSLRAKEFAAHAHTKAVKKQDAAYALFTAAVGLNQEISLADIVDIYKNMLEASITVAKTMTRKKQAHDIYVAAMVAYHDKESEYNNKMIEWQDEKIDHHKTFLAFIQKKSELYRLIHEESTVNKENTGVF
jgi:hypothetical protein